MAEETIEVQEELQGLAQKLRAGGALLARNHRQRSKRYKEMCQRQRQEQVQQKLSDRQVCSSEVGVFAQDVIGYAAGKSASAVTFFVLMRKVLCMFVCAGLVLLVCHSLVGLPDWSLIGRKLAVRFRQDRSLTNQELMNNEQKTTAPSPAHVILQHETAEYSRKHKLTGTWVYSTIDIEHRTLLSVIRQNGGDCSKTLQFYRTTNINLQQLQLGDIVAVYVE